MNMKKYLASLFSSAVLLPALVFAQTGPGPATQTGGATTPPSAQINSLQGVLNLVCLGFDYAFWFLIALAVVFGIIAAFKYLTGSGNPESVKSANSTLLYAAIAVAVALLARGIPLIVASFFTTSGGTLTSC